MKKGKGGEGAGPRKAAQLGQLVRSSAGLVAKKSRLNIAAPATPRRTDRGARPAPVWRRKRNQECGSLEVSQWCEPTEGLPVIDSLNVWHGPVFGLYGDEAKSSLGELGLLTVDCAQSSPNDLTTLAPEDSILADPRNGLWLRGLHSWKADEVSQAIKYFTKHSTNYDIVITMDKPPTKAVTDAATAIHNFQVPKAAKDYAQQISDWLLLRGRGLDKGVAAKLIDYCSPEPEIAQRVALTLVARPAGELITWDTVLPHVAELVQDKVPVWELGKAVGSGDGDAVRRALSTLDNPDSFLTLRYLENRYRMLLLATSNANMDEIRAVSPKANEWVLKKTLSEVRGLTPRLCSLVLSDIAEGFTMLMENSRDTDAAVAVEQCLLKITARHAVAARR